ncbi:GNAT family N-acetyltransferase [Symmachiella dynata]|uniref:GNAT family N-acetyltransferase n=1 Tax=Symmachiella dynata TaxID=2527995 RepID=UPI0011A6B508|nr:GNAT family N-acetyltransferase [Symmachiella dynata]
MTDLDASAIQVRHAEIGDAQALSEFITPFVNEGKLLPRTVDELMGLIPHCFLAEFEGRIIACAALEIYSAKLAEVRSLAVSTNFQRTGIGKRLVTTCVELARSKNVLEVMAVTSSEDFFKSCGFDFTLPGEKKALFVRTRDD